MHITKDIFKLNTISGPILKKGVIVACHDLSLWTSRFSVNIKIDQRQQFDNVIAPNSYGEGGEGFLINKQAIDV